MEQHLNKYKRKNVLITGGAGCIGSSLTKALIKLEAAKIMVLDDLSSSEKWNVPLAPNVVFIERSEERRVGKECSYHWRSRMHW